MIRRLAKVTRINLLPKLLIAVSALAFATLMTLTLWVVATDVREQLQNLTTAYSDGAQWSTAQSDVELLAFLVAAHQLQLAPPETREARRTRLRQRHDIFFSRMNIVKSSPVYAQLRTEPDIIELISQTDDFLKWSSVLMDGPDTTLDAALPEMRQKLAILRSAVRAFTVEAHRRMAAESDRRRENARNIITQIAYLAVALIVLLGSILVMMSLMIRASRRAAINQAKSQTRLQSILSTSLDAILVVDDYGRIIDYNGAAEKLFGHPRARALGMSLGQFVRSPTTADQPVMRLPKPSPDLQRVFGLRADGLRFDAECSVGHLEDTQGAAQVLFLREITDRLNAEAALVEARDQALAGEKVKADMLAVMSHEMRTPLNGILGTLDLMEGLPLSLEARQYLRIIGDSGQLLLGQVNDVLDIARFDAGMMPLQTSVFDLHSLLCQVREVVHNASLGSNNLLIIQQDPLLPKWVRGDLKKLRQVLLNLLGNANKFTRNGQVVLAVAQAKDQSITFSVTDTGIGIAPEHLEAIFEEFVTIDSSYARTNAGSGLGLAITRRLVARMGGTLVVNSQLGQGTQFEATLPLPQIEAPLISEAPEVSAESAKQADSLAVLVIEDNLVNRFVVRGMLEREGHHVVEASNGAEALQLLNTKPFDLILIDIGLPHMDGTEIARLVRSRAGPNQFTRLVALTAHALPADHERFLAAGIDEALTKPLRQATLSRVIKASTPKTQKAPSTPLIDRAQLTDLSTSLGEELYRTLEHRFLEEVSVGIIDMGLLEDTDLRADLAHRLAGSAALFGAPAMHMALITYEAALRAAKAPFPHDEGLAKLWAETRQAFFALKLHEMA